MRPARPHRAQEGRHQGFSPLANHPFSFRTRFARKSKLRFGIAARLPERVSRSGLLPRRGAHRAPDAPPDKEHAHRRLSSRRGAHRAPVYQHPAGASPSCKRQAQTLHRQHPRPRGQARNETVATLSQIKFFHRMWTNLFAVAGSRGHPPAGVIRKRGRSAPSCAPAPRRRTFPLSAGRLFASRSAQCGRAGHISAREARALSSVLSEEIPPGAQCAPLRLPHYGHFSMQISHFSYGNDLRNML